MNISHYHCGAAGDGHTVIGETDYSPGDRAVTLWPFYDPSLPLNIMVVGETNCRPDYHVIRPCSRIMAIEYITAGSGSLEINGKSFRPERGSAFLLTKRSAHAYTSDPKKPWQKRWIVFDGPFAQTMIDFYLPHGMYCFENCALLPYFHEIDQYGHPNKSDYRLLLEKVSPVLYRMILCMHHAATRHELSLPEKIRASMDAQIERKLSLESICAEFNYSKNHIISIFRSAYGVTPYRYFENKKIDVAKLYLSNTQFTIEEIAQQLSYADRNYFSNCFKKHTGFTPAEYRRQYQYLG